MMREQHDKLQEEYSQQELLGGAAALGLQKGVDDKALADNQAYMSAVKSAADELATKGFIDAGRRRNLMELKQQYITNVVPIQNALAERKKAIDIDRERRSKDSTYVSQFDPSKVAVTDYLGNANAFNARGVSGDAIYKDAAQAISNLKGIAASELPALKGSGLMDQYFTLMKNGLQPEQAAALMKKQSKSQAEAESWTDMAKMTVSAIDGAMQRHGVYDIFKDNQAMIDKLWQDTSKAAIFGLGENKVGQITDEMSMYKRKKALEQTTQEEKLIYGQSMNTPIFDEGYRPDNVISLIGGNPIFNKDGSVGNVNDISGLFGGNAMKNLMQKDQDALKGLISAYRKENYTKMNLKGKTDAGVFKIMKGDITGAINASKSKQHNYSPIVDEKTGKQILNTTFSNIPAAEFVDYSSDYKGDSESGIGFTTMAKRLGFQNGQQLLDYMDKHPALMSRTNTDGRFMMQVPSNISGVDKQGNLSFEGGAPEYKMIGWAATNSHKGRVKAINSVRSRITKGDKDTKLISKRSAGNGDVIQTYHDGKSNKIIRIMIDSNGNKIDEGVFSVEDYYNDENSGIHYNEVIPAYNISHQNN